MTKRWMFGPVLATVLAGLSGVVQGQGNTVTISGSGSGAFEDPKVAGGAVGWATCTLTRTTRQIDCTARVYNLVDLRAAHMHVAGPTVAGEVILPIPNLPVRGSGDFAHTWTWKEPDLIPRAAQGILTMDDVFEACSSGNCYLNFPTTLNPLGELRINMCPENRASSRFIAVMCVTQTSNTVKPRNHEDTKTRRSFVARSSCSSWF